MDSLPMALNYELRILTRVRQIGPRDPMTPRLAKLIRLQFWDFIGSQLWIHLQPATNLSELMAERWFVTVIIINNSLRRIGSTLKRGPIAKCSCRFTKLGIDALRKRLDGVFAFAVVDQGRLYFARINRTDHCFCQRINGADD